MKYYKISRLTPAMHKGQLKDVPAVTGDNLPLDQKLLLDDWWRKQEFLAVDYIIKPITHMGFGAYTTWERFNFDFNDFMGSGSGFNGFFMSDKMKQIWETMKILNRHRFYEAELVYKGENYKSWILPVADYQPSPIKLSKWQWGWFKGLFSDTRVFIEPYSGPEIRNYQEFEYQSSVICHRDTLHDDAGNIIININNLQLNVQKFVIPVDFDFALLPYFTGYMVSQRFKDAMDAADITGVHYSLVKFEIEINEGII